MKYTKISSALTILITLFAVNLLITTVSAQKTPLPKCKAAADQIYFVDSGQQVAELHPGGNGYQLNILGSGANKFFLIKEPYMTSVSVISNYTNASQAKWQVYFNAQMGREITSIRMQSECTGRVVHEFPLTVNVTLRNQ